MKKYECVLVKLLFVDKKIWTSYIFYKVSQTIFIFSIHLKM